MDLGNTQNDRAMDYKVAEDHINDFLLRVNLMSRNLFAATEAKKKGKHIEAYGLYAQALEAARDVCNVDRIGLRTFARLIDNQYPKVPDRD